MPSQIGLRHLRALRKSMTNAIGSGVCLAFAWSANAALESGIYLTVPGATILEVGDNVPSRSRTVPLSATLTFDLAGAQPLLTAVIHDAVLEGGSAYGNAVLGGIPQPFELTVHSLYGAQLMDGSYQFTGDYLRDIYPSGTQYLFDWRFSAVGGGSPVWSGQTVWAGGHLWYEMISGVMLVPEPGTLTLFWAGAGIFWAVRRFRR